MSCPLLDDQVRKIHEKEGRKRVDAMRPKRPPTLRETVEAREKGYGYLGARRSRTVCSRGGGGEFSSVLGESVQH
jgi:hypothetical protein